MHTHDHKTLQMTISKSKSKLWALCGSMPILILVLGDEGRLDAAGAVVDEAGAAVVLAPAAAAGAVPSAAAFVAPPADFYVHKHTDERG